MIKEHKNLQNDVFKIAMKFYFVLMSANPSGSYRTVQQPVGWSWGQKHGSPSRGVNYIFKYVMSVALPNKMCVTVLHLFASRLFVLRVIFVLIQNNWRFIVIRNNLMIFSIFLSTDMVFVVILNTLIINHWRTRDYLPLFQISSRCLQLSSAILMWRNDK